MSNNEKSLASCAVSLEDIDSVRYGRQTEGLQKYTDSSADDRCFSIIFKGRRKNLDLIASSKEEAKRWVSGLEKVMTGMNSLNRQQNSEQYPWTSIPQTCSLNTFFSTVVIKEKLWFNIFRLHIISKLLVFNIR